MSLTEISVKRRGVERRVGLLRSSACRLQCLATVPAWIEKARQPDMGLQWKWELKVCARGSHREDREFLWNLRRRIHHREAALKRLGAFMKRAGLRIRPMAEPGTRSRTAA